jgi:hypothetical protein
MHACAVCKRLHACAARPAACGADTDGRHTAAANAAVFFLLLHRIRQKLPEGSRYAGVRVPIVPTVPHAASARAFVALAGPILGVLTLKVLLYGLISARAAGISTAAAAGHRILFGAFATLVH